jgi:cyanate permease
MFGLYCKVKFLNKNIMTTKKEDKSSWAIGGMTMIGIGVGLIFVQTSPILFIASILIGIGLGLVITPFISDRKEQ